MKRQGYVFHHSGADQRPDDRKQLYGRQGGTLIRASFTRHPRRYQALPVLPDLSADCFGLHPILDLRPLQRPVAGQAKRKAKYDEGLNPVASRALKELP